MDGKYLDPERQNVDLTNVDKASHRIMGAARLNAEIEAMRAANQQSRINGESPAYGEQDFYDLLNDYNKYL